MPERKVSDHEGKPDPNCSVCGGMECLMDFCDLEDVDPEDSIPCPECCAESYRKQDTNPE